MTYRIVVDQSSPGTVSNSAAARGPRQFGDQIGNAEATLHVLHTLTLNGFGGSVRELAILA